MTRIQELIRDIREAAAAIAAVVDINRGMLSDRFGNPMEKQGILDPIKQQWMADYPAMLKLGLQTLEAAVSELKTEVAI